jgi:hypothetical protein
MFNGLVLRRYTMAPAGRDECRTMHLFLLLLPASSSTATGRWQLLLLICDRACQSFSGHMPWSPLLQPLPIVSAAADSQLGAVCAIQCWLRQQRLQNILTLSMILKTCSSFSRLCSGKPVSGSCNRSADVARVSIVSQHEHQAVWHARLLTVPLALTK